MTQTELVATVAHVRAAGFCARGGRAACERLGLDWRQLRTTGIPVSELRATGDALAIAVADQAAREYQNG